MDEQQTPEKSISSELLAALKKLSVDQVRYVVARMDYPTKGEAATAIGLKPDTVYRWNGDVEKAVELMALDNVASAKTIRLKNLVKAMAVKVKGLDSEDEKIRQNAATELIEWELGKALQKSDVTSGGEALQPKETDNAKFDRAISSLADAIRESISGTGAKQNGEVDTPK